MDKNYCRLLLKVLLVSFVAPITFFQHTNCANGQEKIAQVPLGEKIQQEQSTLQGDKARLRQDQSRARNVEHTKQQYIQSTEQWIQQNDAQMQDNETKLNQLELTIKSKPTLRKLLNTPGNQFYVLNTLLRTESAMKAQAEANVQKAEQSLNAAQSVVQQDRYHITSDLALVQHDQANYRDEMDFHADLLRQRNDAIRAGDRSGERHGRFYTNFNQSAYDAGRHQVGLGNPYWRLRYHGTSD
jgi:hypothetical protein